MADSSPLAHSPTLAAGAPRVPDDAEQLAAGTAVGDYVVERFLGAGAMGEVYAGKHPVIGKRVAIKVLRHELAASAEAAERFIREARAVNQIEHENVVDVFAFGRLEDGRLYLAMDLVEGKSLRARLVDGPLPMSEALDILDTIAAALDAAHTRGVVHRDLKPDNIMLSNATPPKVMILDFGIAKLISKANEGKPTGPSTLTGAGTWLGTPSYMAPEQWSVDGAGPASDRYALGVIAFELLAGAPPFHATSVPAMMEHHFRTKVPALSTRGAVDVPEAVDDVLAKALAKDPEARYPTARAFVEALRDAAGTQARRARAAVPTPGAARRPWIPALAGAGLLGGALVVVLAVRGDRDRPTTNSASSATHAPGAVVVEVRSTPPGAEVRRGSMVVGTTPAKLDAQPGERVELDIRKPGYLLEHRSITAGPDGALLQVSLPTVQRFEGTWRLASGELRHFARRGDEVDVFKLTEVAGQREFFKTYGFALADIGVVFGGEEFVRDSRAPNEPSCNVRMRVDYHYDPTHDTLEQRRDKVSIELANGKCVVQSRTIEPSLLVRVGDTVETTELATPVGVLEKGKAAPPTKNAKPQPKNPTKTIPLDPKSAELAKLKAQKADLDAKSKLTKQATTPKKSTKGGKQAAFDFGDAQQNEAGSMNAPTSSAGVAKKPTSTYTPPQNQQNAAPSKPQPQAQSKSSVPPQAQIQPQPQPATPQVSEPPAQAPEQQQAPIRKK